MALTLEDILKLPGLADFRLLSGEHSLHNPISSVGIADYEFVPGLHYDNDVPFDPDSMVLSSLLFAKDDPAQILPALRTIAENGASAFAFKRTFYQTLPEDALTYAQEIGFPVFSFGRFTWLESLTYEITAAIQQDDERSLPESLIRSWLETDRELSPDYLNSKGLSFLNNKYLAAAYYKEEELDPSRLIHGFYAAKGLREKLMMIRYDDGLFLVSISNRSDPQSHQIIQEQAREVLFPGGAALAMSPVRKGQRINLAIRQSYYMWLAARLSQEQFVSYESLGLYRALIPLCEAEELQQFAIDCLGKLGENRATAEAYVRCHGDYKATADRLHCHHNTVRYRIGKIKEQLGVSSYSDQELFRDLSLALIIDACRR